MSQVDGSHDLIFHDKGGNHGGSFVGKNGLELGLPGVDNKQGFLVVGNPAQQAVIVIHGQAVIVENLLIRSHGLHGDKLFTFLIPVVPYQENRSRLIVEHVFHSPDNNTESFIQVEGAA